MFRDNRKEYEKKWNDIEIFIKYGMLTDEKFYDQSKKFFLFSDVNDNYYTLRNIPRLFLLRRPTRREAWFISMPRIRLHNMPM